MQKSGSAQQMALSLFALAALLGGIDLVLLMPAARHANAGAITQVLPLVLAVISLALLAAGLALFRSRRP
jgi:hypothetical protein